MTESSSNKPAGWDYIFQKGMFPPRYQTSANPNQSVVDWAETLSPNSFVLDVGCGVGRHVVYLSARGLKMAGTDISPNGVEQTKTACEQHNIHFDGRVADMTALPWADQTFDAVLSTATICHHRLADIERTLAEMHRVLKTGGLLLVDFLHKGTRSYQNILEQVKSGKLSEVEPNTFIDDSPQPDLMDDAFLPHHYSDEDEIRRLLGGFEILKLSADLDPAEANTLPRRGYWVAWGRKSANTTNE